MKKYLILPALLVGSGLKHPSKEVSSSLKGEILPALLVGSGLKLLGWLVFVIYMHSPGFIGREWIETKNI